MTMAQLANFYCEDTFTVPLDGLEPGPHPTMGPPLQGVIKRGTNL